jgi:hypothetical protein
MPQKDLKWAAKIIIQMANIPVQPKLISAFENYEQNKMWVLGVIKKASPPAGSLNNPYYQQAMEILKSNGIDVNIYDTNR